jgi:hypothetical protein
LLHVIKRILNVFVVQGAGVGELLFSGSVRKSLGTLDEKVLVTVILLENPSVSGCQSSFSLSLNCADAVMCTTLNEEFKKVLLRRGTMTTATSGTSADF